MSSDGVFIQRGGRLDEGGTGRSAPVERAPEPQFLQGGGEMGRRMRAFDWTGTSLGAAESWPQSLKTVVRILLSSRYAMWMAWGPDLIFFCNDAYKPTLGVKEAWALGAPSTQVWSEIWPDIGPRIDHVLTTGVATWDEGLLLFLERSGFPEETYHTFSYSPLADDEGAIVGMLCVVTEVTEGVIGTRRLGVLRDLGARLAEVRALEDVTAATEACLQAESHDLPFTLTYLVDENGKAKLAAATGVKRGGRLAPEQIFISSRDVPWPIGAVLERGAAVHVDDLGEVEHVAGPWDRVPSTALVTPIVAQGHEAPAGVVVAGLNPYRPADETYLGFIDLFVGQMAGALASAKVFEEERRRAEALAEIDRAKTLFFSNVSHEFRTPLTLMLGPLEDALGDEGAPLSGAQHERLETAYRNSLRLLKLVNSLLDFSRIEAGRVQASFQPVDLALSTTELASNFRSAIERAGLTYGIACEPLPHPVHVDRDMWEKIVLNLLSNAFKFTFDGEIGVHLRPTSDGRAAELVVRDSGVGLPPDEIPRLFERFHRIEGQKSRSFEGSGIGLALVQELIRQHGGTISVESAVGCGTTFTITVPFGTDHLPAHLITAEPVTVGMASRAEAYVEEASRWLPDGGEDARVMKPDVSGLPRDAEAGAEAHVLLADDNADMRDYLRHLLEPRWSVETAADGQEALDAVRRRKPDLLLTDVMMPGLDGFGLLREIRADPELRDLPVIMLSARAGEEARVEGLDAGADDYLIKPFPARELLARVAANLTLAQVRREAMAAVRELNATLEQRIVEAVDERSRAEEQLRQAQKMEAIGQLTGGVAHDFNNLLTIIRSSVDLLRKRDLPEERRSRYIDAIGDTADRAAILTGQLLAFARRQPLRAEVFDAGEKTRQAAEMLRTVVGTRIVLALDVPVDPCFVDADLTQFETALINIAVNARDAMSGAGELTISVRPAAEIPGSRRHLAVEGEFVAVLVRDTGAGIAAGEIDRIFEPFYTTKEVGEGTGLGLSQVYGFAKQSNGEVRVESAIGEGATFTLYLPKATRAPNETDTAPQRGAAAQPAHGRVLIVEDNAQVGDFAAQLLKDLGYVTTWVSDAESALKTLEMHPDGFDLVFSDVVMPGAMSGVDLARKLKRRLPKLPVVLTTGYSDVLAHEGAVGFELLRKPYSVEALSHLMRRMIVREMS